MEDFLIGLFKNSAIPVWLLCLAGVAFVIEYLARGKTGQFIGEWFKRRADRSRTAEETLISILREMVEEQSREIEGIEALIELMQKRILKQLDESIKGIDITEVRQELKSLGLRVQEQRNLVTALNASLAHFIDITRDGLGEAAIRRAEFTEKINSMAAYLTRSERG